MSVLTEITSDLVSVKKAADLLQMSVATIRNWANKGYVKKIRLGGCIYLSQKNISEFIQSAFDQSVNPIGKPIKAPAAVAGPSDAPEPVAAAEAPQTAVEELEKV